MKRISIISHISYVEFASSPVHNLGAVEDVLRHMLECDCGYVGINFPIDYLRNAAILVSLTAIIALEKNHGPDSWTIHNRLF